MAFGLPVVAFDLRETMATADAAGAYVPQPDAAAFAEVLLQLLDDPDRRAKMATFGREKFVRELAWHDQAAKYVQVYDTLREQ
jgi:glycosyltransferase involved in cell wall biosynthesis